MDQEDNRIEPQTDAVINDSSQHCSQCDGCVHLLFKGIRIWNTKHREEAELWFRTPTNKAVLQMVFCTNNLNSRVNDIQQDSHCLFFIPASCSNHLFEEIPAHSEVMGVHVDAALLYDLLPNENSLSSSLKEKINADHAVMLSAHHPLTIGMKEIIYQILSCLRKDDCRCLFFHAKVVELLSLQLEQLENIARNENAATSPALKKDELSRVYRVKEILEQNPQEKFSLLGLAHAVGTNDATLKKHFKAVFGMTVFNYLNAYRMEQAKKLLIGGEHKVSSIAQQFGYKHATHFSAAFKKYFGFPPTGLK